MRAGLAAALLALWCGGAAAAPAVDWLHVEGNEGGSSGGHAALAVGDEVFHFQHVRGLLLLVREDAGTAERRYRLLENRPIHRYRLALGDAAATALRDALVRRALAQDRQLARRDALAADRALLAGLAARARGEPATTEVPGAGLFVGGDLAPGAAEPALVALRATVAARLGAGALAARRSRLAAWRAALAPDAAVAVPTPTPDEPGPAHWGFARRWHDATVARAALRALAGARPLAPAVIVDTGVALGPADADLVGALADALAARLVVLVDRARPEQAEALVLGLARLAALERTRRAGRWIVLDGFPAGAAAFDADAVAARRADLAPLAAEARRRAGHALAALAAAPRDGRFPEADFAAFETAANRHAELARAIATGRPLRVHAGPLLPDRSAVVGLAPPPWPAARLAAAHAAAAARERRYAAALARLLDYDLVGHNCVTELLALVHAAAPAAPLEATGAFIPFVAARAVARAWPVTAAETLPSRRQATLATQAPGLARWLREGNVVTATAYRPNPDDSLFLFFTDDAAAARPLLGAANLVVALGGAVVALPLAPFDGGARLAAAVRGAFWSLPELVFFSVRKGSYPLLPPEPDAGLQSGTESAEIAVCGGSAPTASSSSGPS